MSCPRKQQHRVVCIKAGSTMGMLEFHSGINRISRRAEFTLDNRCQTGHVYDQMMGEIRIERA